MIPNESVLLSCLQYNHVLKLLNNTYLLTQTSNNYYKTTTCFISSQKHTRLLLHWSRLTIPLWPPIQQYMRFRPMNSIMNPTSTLLNPQRPPFRLRHQPPFRNLLRYLRRQHHMSIFIHIIIVTFRVLNPIRRH